MKIIKAIFPIFLLAVLLVSCGSVTPPPIPKPTKIPATDLASPTATLALIPTPVPPTLDPNINIVATPKPNQQVYTDPEGWYSVNFPADMKPSGKPNSFWSGQGDTFETGYLPEMGYVSRATFVCAWLANVEFKPEKSSTSGASQYTNCSASTTSDFGENVHYSIYENPGADPAHRFVYVKTSSYPNSGKLETAFSWLKAISKTKLETGASPLSLQDAAFWKNTSPMPPGVSITEYALMRGTPHPFDHGLNPDIPTEIEPTNDISTYTPTPRRTAIEQLGYTEKTIPIKPYIPTPGTVCQFCKTQLYRNGRLLFDDVYYVSDVYTFSTDSGPITAFLVDSGKDSFLIENDAIRLWDRPYDFQFHDFFKPLLYQGELLWINKDGHSSPGSARVQTSSRKTVFSFIPYDDSPMSHFGNPIGIRKFISWNGHWILTFGDFLVQDGEIINKKLGYQQIFDWNLINNKPAYFFNKGPRFGLSYDGQVLPLQYEEIANGICCWDNGVAPWEVHAYISGDSARFYGKRNGVWYYVVVKFK